MLSINQYVALQRSVLVNLKTVQAWEDVVSDLGQVLKMRGPLTLQTPWGQDVSRPYLTSKLYSDHILESALIK